MSKSDIHLHSDSFEDHENREGCPPAHGGHGPKEDQHFVQCRCKFELHIVGCYIISSKGALYVILPYDYPAQQRHPLFEHTPVLNNNFEYCRDDYVDCDFYED